MIKITFFLLGSLLGFLAWGNDIALTLLSPLLFLVYFRTEKRLNLYLFTLGYYLASSRGLLIGTYQYYSDIKIALILWMSVAILVSMPWIIFWSKSIKRRYLYFPLALAASILPPFGFIAWSNPLPSAGLIFPGSGFLGMILLLGLVYGVSYLIDRAKWDNMLPLKLIVFFSLIMTFGLGVSKLNNPKGSKIDAIETSFKYDPDKPDRLKDFIRISKYLEIASASPKKEILLPENALGFYRESQRVAWRDLTRSKVIYAGAYIPIAGTKYYDNVLLQVDSNSSKILYRQRVPVPVSMWKPFSDQGARATFYKDPTIEINGEKVGVLICYEQLLTYVMLQTMYYDPKSIIGISNLYWSQGTSIEQIQRESLDLYGLLFGVDVYFSVNR